MRSDLFVQLVESVKEVKAIQAGKVKPARVTRAEDLLPSGTPDVALLRSRFQLSQAEFAVMLGVSVHTLQGWERGRRQPEGPARVLLRVAAARPDVMLAVTQQPKKPRAR